uniref:A24 family peptidase n=1 Tax=Thaumasiovibrio occultus TaxID=1891184 RepID=UPI000B361E07|nr:A24 family peptidase [Thaumasiovibrio occultus]
MDWLLELLWRYGVLAILLGVSLWLCVSDVHHRRLPDRDVAWVLIFSLITNVQYHIGVSTVLSMAAVLVFGFILFALRVIAAGDIKLLTAYCAAIPFSLLPTVLMLMALSGGVIAACYITRTAIDKRPERLKQQGLPYGIPIAFAGYSGVILATLI